MNRLIIFGRVHFKNKRSVNLARTEFVRYAETIAKYDLIFKPEALFGEDPEAEVTQLHLEFERKIHEATDKTLANTSKSLELLMQFAIAGRVDVFVLTAGELPRQRTLLVRNDKSTVHHHTAGLDALEDLRYREAITHLTDAIDSHGDHPWALDSRGQAFLATGDLAAAQRDLEAAATAYPALPSPHLGLAKIFRERGDDAAALKACDKAMQGSIPHQPGYWITALFKVEVLLDQAANAATASGNEATAKLHTAKSLLDRYDAKLRQLGDARTDLYPGPERVALLRERHGQLSGAAVPA